MNHSIKFNNLYFILLVLFLFPVTTRSQVYNVQHYDIQLDLTHSLIFDNHYFQGKVRTSLTIDTVQTNQIIFDSFGLQIDSIKIDNLNLSYSTFEGLLTIDLDRNYYQNEELMVDVFYSHPDSFSSGGYRLALPGEYLAQKVAYVYGLIRYTHYWVPCKDDLSDKASLDITIAVPSPNYIVAANGNLIELFTLENKTYYHWRDTNPLKIANIFFSVSEYQVLTHSFLLNGVLKDIEFYVYPVNGSLNFNQQICFDKIIEILQFYSSLYIDYPFDNLKFVFAEGMYSNQTIINIDEISLQHLSSSGYSVFTHEIAHQWYGSYINSGSLRELWLNEGFATYCGLLFKNHKYGYQEFRNELNFTAQLAMQIDVPLVNDSLYQQGIYKKGPCVIDMLRYCLGDSLYWSSMNMLFEDFAFQSFTSLDLLNIIESVSNEDYSWFFDQWVFNAGFPIYEIEINNSPLTANDYQVNIFVKQVQSTRDYFKMPLPFRITTPLADTTIMLLNDSREQNFSIVVQGNPTNIKFDEENRILLKKVNSITGIIDGQEESASSFELFQNYPNPFNPVTIINYNLRESGVVKLKVFDILGQEIRTLVNEYQESGKHTINFNANDLNSGLYLYKLETNGFNKTRKMTLVK